MDSIKTDLLIIGGGPGGYVSAIYAAKKGKKVILIEKLWIGGTCLNEGCIPTKALIKNAELYHDILTAKDKGINVDNLSVDLGKIIENKNLITDKLVNGITYLLDKYGVQTIKGHARFINDYTVEVSNDKTVLINAKDIIIATGSKTKHLPIKGLDSKNVFDSEKLLNNTHLPKSMTVIGGGIIGMEFAFIYANLGVKVNVVEFLPRILPGIDKELAMRLIRFAKQLNIDIYTSSAVKEVVEEDDLLRVMFIRKDKPEQIESEFVLEAVGRKPNIDNLGLENTNIEFSEVSGIKVNSMMKTNVSNIYAIGDVTNILQLAHVASHQGLVAVNNILGIEKEMDYFVIPAVIFTSPTIANVGLSEEFCKESNIEYDVVKVPYSANGKALILDSETGYIKLLRNTQTKKLIGAMIFGKEAENLIASYTIAIKNNLTADDIKETVFAHPTIQELVHESALGLDKEAIHFID